MSDTEQQANEGTILSFTGAQHIADIPRRLFGSFIEHLGRSVYGGIYDPEHESADDQGFRHDVIDLVKELGVTCVRYPGGNFVSNYRWEDGTGPREQRPIRRDLAWHTTEPNAVGIDDFYRWSQLAGTEIMMAVNMGTQGLQSAIDELEYTNGAAGTALADRRIANGITEPMDIRMWCIGNEMDGPWQVGHMDAEEYAKAVERVAHAMKLADPGLELVACGSSSASMPTFGIWERTVLTRAYEYLSFVSCHAYYFERGSKSPQDFLACGENMKHFITTVAEQADTARQAHNGDHDIALSFDEWGVWNQDVWNNQEREWNESRNTVHHEPWPVAPHLLEDTYTVRDAVVEGALMIELLSHCDRVRSASRAQLVNVIAPIMTEDGGKAWKQTVFLPFAFAAHHAIGDAYVPDLHSPQIHTQSYGDVDALRAVITFDQQTRSGSVLMVNRDIAHDHALTLDLSSVINAVHSDASSAEASSTADAAATHNTSDNNASDTGLSQILIDEQVLLHDADPYATNTIDHPTRVTLHTLELNTDVNDGNNGIDNSNSDNDNSSTDGNDTAHAESTTHTNGIWHITLPAESWAGIAFHIA